MQAIMTDFIIWGRLTRPRGPFRAQGFALTRNVARSQCFEIFTRQDGFCFSIFGSWQVVRSTLFWLLTLAAPSGEIGGVPGICGREAFDLICPDHKMEKPESANMVSDTSECVDSESAIDSLKSLCLISIRSNFRSDMVDIGCQKC